MNKLFKLSSPLPISVSVKILGPGLSFPMGAWSPIMTVPWKSGTIFIPKLF
jgi:hypothetical protein